MIKSTARQSNGEFLKAVSGKLMPCLGARVNVVKVQGRPKAVLVLFPSKEDRTQAVEILKARGEAVGMTAEVHVPLNSHFKVIGVEEELDTEEVLQALRKSMLELSQETLRNGIRAGHRDHRSLALRVSAEVRVFSGSVGF